MTPSALWTLVLLSASAAWTAGIAIEGVPPAYLAVVAGLAVLEMEAFRRVDAVRGRLMAVGELAGLLVVAVVPYLLVSIVVTTSLSTALAGVAAAFLVWMLASMSATDLEAVVEPTDLIEGLTGPAGRLASRLWLVGLGLTVAMVVAHGSLAPVIEARPVRPAIVVPYLAYWLVGLASLSAIHRSRNLARWQRDQARVDSDLRSRWSGATQVWLAAATALVALIWWPSGKFLTAAHAASSGLTLAISGWLTRILNPRRTQPSNRVLPGVETTLPDAPPPSRLIAPPPEWWDLIVILAIGVFFALAYTLLTRRSRRARISEGRRDPWLQTFLALIFTIGEALLTLLRTLLGFRRRQPTSESYQAMVAPPRLRTVWVPPDRIRRRIAAAYRVFVNAAAEEVGTPLQSETSAEYGHRVNERLRNEPAVIQLSGLYAEARFSAHDLADDHADRAELWRKQIVAQLTETKSAETFDVEPTEGSLS